MKLNEAKNRKLIGGDFRGSKEKEKSRKEKEIVPFKIAGMESLVRMTGFPSGLYCRSRPPAAWPDWFLTSRHPRCRWKILTRRNRSIFSGKLEKIPDETAREARRAEIHRQFNLWPFTAQVVCIAMLNADTARGQVLFTRGGFRGGSRGSRARWNLCPARTSWNCSPPSGTWPGIMRRL